MTMSDLHQYNLEESMRLISAKFGSKACFTSSLGKEDQIITNVISTHNLDIIFVTLDTCRNFPEYYDLLQITQTKYGRELDIYFPDNEQIEHYAKTHGVNGFYKSVELRKECCRIRKIEPLKRALMGAEIWITGLRSSQSENRAAMKLYERDPMTGILKFNPLLEWSDPAVDSYIRTHNIPVNPMHSSGFPSIGCAPCTRAVEPGEHPRAGRWWWEGGNKECGLHSES